MNMQKDLVTVTLALNIYKLSVAMVGVFIPLVILQSGGRLWMIAGFYFLYAVTKLFFNYNAMRYIQKKGAHLGLGLGFGFGILQLVTVLAYTVNQNPILLVAGAVCLALTNSFLWNAQHLFISRALERSTRSSTIATMEIIGQAFGILGPIIGGFIGLQFGSFWLLFAALVVTLTTTIPLARMRKIESNNFSTDSIAYNLKGAPKRDLFANFCFNIETTIGVMLWPIYLAVVLNTFGAIGAIAALTAIASIITTWLAGRRGDRGNGRSVLLQGVSVMSVINIFRIFVQTPLTIGIVSAIYQSSLSYLQNSWTSAYYHHAKEKGSQYIISMEIACDLAYVAVWGILSLVLFITSSENAFFVTSFLVASFAAWGCLFMPKTDSLQNE